MQSNTQEILDMFCKLTTIPHGSGNTDQMLNYIKNFAIDNGYEVKIDSAKNLLAFKSGVKPKICYQSHYDMVCVGNAVNNVPLKLSFSKDIMGDKTYTWLKAQDSSLGADNGMGIAIMMYFMKRGYECEFLFTSDEEIGMIGAKQLEIPIESNLLINLDSEVLGEVTVSCAGGFDLLYESCFDSIEIAPNWNYYILEARGFAGGHSGLDINNKAENFQNAILKSIEFLSNVEQDIYVINWNGGEKRNSIPMRSKLIFATKDKIQQNQIKDSKFFSIQELRYVDNELLNKTNEIFLKTPSGIELSIITKLLDSIKIGVMDYREDLVINSRSLASISFANGILKLAFMGRANVKKLLDSNHDKLKSKLNQKLPRQKKDSIKIETQDYYPPWERLSSNNTTILDKLLESMLVHTKDFNINPKVVELHAGLECGVLLERLASMGLHNIHALSIGPTIHSPHSINERVWVESASIIIDVLEDFLEVYA